MTQNTNAKGLRIRSILRKVGIGALCVVALVAVTILVVVNCVLTDSRLRPIIDKYAHEYLDAEVSIANAQGTFFKSFPYLGVRLDSCVIVSNAFHHAPAPLENLAPLVEDSLRRRRDTLLTVDRIVVGLDLLQFLNGTDDIELGVLYLQSPKVRLIADTLGHASWDIMRPTPNDTTPSTTRFGIKRIRLDNARAVYFSQSEQMWLFADSVNLKSKGYAGLNDLDADIDLDVARVSMGQRQILFMRKLPLGLHGNIVYAADSSRFDLNDLSLTLSKTTLDVGGFVRTDTAGAFVDVTYNIDSPDAKNIFAAIPKDLVNVPIEVKDGSVALNGYVRGRAAEGEMPVVQGSAKVLGVRAQYEGQPEEIEDFTADFNMLIDKSMPDSSFVNLDIFHFKGGKTEVSAVVRVTQLLAQAMLNCKVDAHVDFEDLGRVFPLSNTNMKGVVDANFGAFLPIDEALKHNLRDVKLKGDLKFDNVSIVNDTLGFHFLVNSSVSMKTDKVVALSSKLSHLRMRTPNMWLGVRNGNFEFATKFDAKDDEVTPIDGLYDVERVFYGRDSMMFALLNIKGHDLLRPQTRNPAKLDAKHHMRVDTVMAAVFGNRVVAHNIIADGLLRANHDTTWHFEARVGHSDMKVASPYLNLPVAINDFSAALVNDSLSLERCLLSVGQSKVRTSGHVANIFMKDKSKPLIFNMDADADTLNVSQIIAAIVADADPDTLSQTAAIAARVDVDSLRTDSLHLASATAVDSATAADATAPMAMFNVPQKLRMNVGVRAKAVVWNKLTMRDARTQLKIVNGAAHMTNLMFRMGDGIVISTLAYKAWPRKGVARTNFFTRWERADIAELTQALNLDTVFPFLKPMSGKIDCYLAAEVEMDSLMNVNLPTARASIHLGGQKLTLLDNDEFRKIGKKLMFKNKDRNVIDTLSMNILVDSGKVQVLPCVINIDRYRMAFGGKQDLDMNLDYHISILKSPLPFKAGANIKGNLEDFDVDITTAKLKKKVSAEQLAQYDSTSLKLRMVVLRNSYILSGLPVPDIVRNLPGLTDGVSNFALRLQEDNATEEELREAEQMRLLERSEDSAAVAEADTVSAQPMSQPIPQPDDNAAAAVDPATTNDNEKVSDNGRED